MFIHAYMHNRSRSSYVSGTALFAWYHLCFFVIKWFVNRIHIDLNMKTFFVCPERDLASLVLKNDTFLCQWKLLVTVLFILSIWCHNLICSKMITRLLIYACTMYVWNILVFGFALFCWKLSFPSAVIYLIFFFSFRKGPFVSGHMWYILVFCHCELFITPGQYLRTLTYFCCLEQDLTYLGVYRWFIHGFVPICSSKQVHIFWN